MDALLITCNAARTKVQLFMWSLADGEAVYSPGKQSDCEGGTKESNPAF